MPNGPEREQREINDKPDDDRRQRHAGVDDDAHDAECAKAGQAEPRPERHADERRNRHGDERDAQRKSGDGGDVVSKHGGGWKRKATTAPLYLRGYNGSIPCRR
ncbi:MAG: hypothetical protein QM775_04855 [Pirellulales bacterium]